MSHHCGLKDSGVVHRLEHEVVGVGLARVEVGVLFHLPRALKHQDDLLRAQFS